MACNCIGGSNCCIRQTVPPEGVYPPFMPYTPAPWDYYKTNPALWHDPLQVYPIPVRGKRRKKLRFEKIQTN